MTFKATIIAIALPLLAFSHKNDSSITNDVLGPQPFSFIENRGQITDEYGKSRNDIDYKLQTNEITIHIGNGSIHYQWNKTRTNDALTDPGKMALWKVEQDVYRVDVSLIGANVNAEVIGTEKQDYYEKYFTPAYPDGIITYSYNKIIYKDIYPKIDWVLYTVAGNGGQSLKYDFVVHPGGNPEDIKLQYRGAGSMNLLNGEFWLTTPFGSLTEAKPYSYIEDSGDEVPSAFRLEGDILSFDIEPQNKTIVIDPVLNWGTYYTNPSTTIGKGLISDASGNVYFTGYTTASNIASTGAYQATYGGNTDGFIVKLSRTGVRLWATYYGGQDHDAITAMTTDLDGSIYIAGHTSDTTLLFATTGCHQDSNGGNGVNGQTLIDCFLAKFNANGQRQWSTYYGGYFNDYIMAATCDDSGNVFIGGYTESPTNISTPGSFRSTFGGSIPGSSNEGFFVKFNPSGVRQWGTYYAGRISTMATGRDLSLYIGGTVAGITVGIATLGAHQINYGGGGTDGFFAKFAKWGSLRYFGSFYGGSDEEEVNAIAVDSLDNFYIGGSSISFNTNNRVATSGAYQDTLSVRVSQILINPDAMLVKFNPSGVRQWGTYYGDSVLEAITDLEISADGYIYGGGYQQLIGNSVNAMVLKFDDTGGFRWKMQYGGTATESGSLLSLCYSKLYLAGGTQSNTGIATPGAWQTAYTSFPDAVGYIAQFQADTNLFLNKKFPDTALCIGGTYYMDYHTTNRYGPNNTFTVQLSDINGSFSNPVNIGTKIFDSSGAIVYTIPANITPGKGYSIRVISSAPADTTEDNWNGIRMSLPAHPAAIATSPACESRTLQLNDTSTNNPAGTTYEWFGPANYYAATQNAVRSGLQNGHSGDYVIAAQHQGCIVRDTVTVTIKPTPVQPTIQQNSPVCVGDTIRIEAGTTTPGITSYDWLNYHGSALAWHATNMDKDTIIAPAKLSDSGTYKISAVLNGCPSDTATVVYKVQATVVPSVQITASPGTLAGPFVTIDFSISNVSGEGTTPTYQWTKNSVNIPGAATPTYQTQTTGNLQTGDNICLIITSSLKCASPKTANSCLEITVDLGVDNTASSERLNIYPNPTSGVLNIETKKPGVLYIYDIQGQVVGFYDIPRANTTIDLPAALAPGVYTAKFVAQDNSVSVHRVVLNK